MGERSGQSGQGTVEWIGLVLVVSLALAAIGAGIRGSVPGTGLARAIATRLICAADLSESCSTDSALVAAYGPELAARLSENAPEVVYEQGMTALPVDFRSCRAKRCGNGPDSGPVWRSDTGERAIAFVHAVDCRPAAGRADSERRGYDCSPPRAGNLYLQYWLYYEDSTSLRDLPGAVGSHQDDWESYQVRIGPGGTEARATSHHGYNYDGGVGSWLSDAGVVHRSAWGHATGRVYVSGGSHAGRVHDDGRPRPRWTPASRLTLVPVEALDRAARRTKFAVAPPWRKPVYGDPEDQGT